MLGHRSDVNQRPAGSAQAAAMTASARPGLTGDTSPKSSVLLMIVKHERAARRCPRLGNLRDGVGPATNALGHLLGLRVVDDRLGLPVEDQLSTSEPI